MPKFGKLVPALLLSLVALFAVGCGVTKPAQVNKLYENSVRQDSYNNILVVSVGKKKGNRAKMEKELVKNISENNGTSISAVGSMAANSVLNKETVTQLVLDKKVDGVLVINLLESAVKVEVDEKRTEMVIERPRPDKLLDVFVQRYKEVDINREMNINATVVISADFYSGETGDKIWSAQATVFDGTEADSIIEDAAKAVVKQMVKDKLI
jgi:hypothetical protein